jgi:hypothetical protein
LAVICCIGLRASYPNYIFPTLNLSGPWFITKTGDSHELRFLKQTCRKGLPHHIYLPCPCAQKTPRRFAAICASQF